MEYLPLFRGGNPAGRAILEQQPLYMRIQVRMPARSGLWRAWLIGESGEIRVGTLEPRGSEAVITRRFSRQALSTAGKLLRVEVRPDHPESSPERDSEPNTKPGPERDNPERNPERGRNKSGETLERWADGVRYLAYPYEHNQPFPKPDLFCLARMEFIHARKYWVFAFNRANWPVVPAHTPFS